jgi:hypothetical protein
MHRAIDATIATDGKVRLSEPISLPHECRAIVTILDDLDIPETALLSEKALGTDWDKPEEDKAWAHLQKAR